MGSYGVWSLFFLSPFSLSLPSLLFIHPCPACFVCLRPISSPSPSSPSSSPVSCQTRIGLPLLEYQYLHVHLGFDMEGYLFCTSTSIFYLCLSVGLAVVWGLRDVFGCSFSYFYDIFTTRFSNEEGREREKENNPPPPREKKCAKLVSINS